MRICVKFSREGFSKYLAHLDMQRMFVRAIKRADLPAKYSAGFNPHMNISFAYPLGVGIETRGDYLEFFTTEDIDIAAAEQALRLQMPEGFGVQAMGELDEMSKATLGSYDNAIKAMELDDVSHAVKTAFLEQQVNKMEKDLRQGHINRLSNAECSVSAGVRFLDLLGNLERVSDHAMNIAQVVLNDHRTEKNYHSESFLEEEPYV